MDEGDLVVKLEERQFAQFEKQRKQTSSQPSRTECIECDNPIPAARQKAVQGVQLCIVCQSAKE